MTTDQKPSCPHPLLVKDFLARQQCKSLIQFFRTHRSRPRSYQGLVNKNLRNCDFVECSLCEPSIRHFVVTQMCPAFDLSFGEELANVPLIYRYPPGVGFVVHHDAVTSVELDRSKYNRQPVVAGDFTVVLFLNEPPDYEGGELYFPDFDLSFSPPTGSALAFPATEAFMHGVRPVISGERFTIVSRVFVHSANAINPSKIG